MFRAACVLSVHRLCVVLTLSVYLVQCVQYIRCMFGDGGGEVQREEGPGKASRRTQWAREGRLNKERNTADEDDEQRSAHRAAQAAARRGDRSAVRVVRMSTRVRAECATIFPCVSSPHWRVARPLHSIPDHDRLSRVENRRPRRRARRRFFCRQHSVGRPSSAATERRRRRACALRSLYRCV